MIIKNSKDMGHMVRNTRKDKKITQAQLAAAAGVGVRFIVDLESGKETIALILQIRPEYRQIYWCGAC